ncbi:hypothetical protein H257_17852 [Aphanomyces astaci]|uniref:Uncharacterized protein n=1 Tax=Aphanomyces astaci TaxID=112090 RepID=W4FEY6_APHAT|nr:hypothetical protein H257_17852 [Aphanomyces astaci]ETV65391.1 hypothetical protein H257_17852 [Aphanomyces astaci]|eukprot:XP_009845106.1 hypothetical protein H257_17852 [Aphanomyces astaci]
MYLRENTLASREDILGTVTTFFLQLAAQAVQQVDGMRDSNGLTYAPKVMIKCGIALDITGRWHEKQVTPDLSAIITKYPPHYDGGQVPSPSSSI